MRHIEIKPRDDKGRFLAFFCDDRNCSGVLVLDPGAEWRTASWYCDGLTFDADGEPLRACTRCYPAAAMRTAPEETT